MTTIIIDPNDLDYPYSHLTSWEPVKKIGRPRMEETFFYNPYDHWIMVDPDNNLVVIDQCKGIWL